MLNIKEETENMKKQKEEVGKIKKRKKKDVNEGSEEGELKITNETLNLEKKESREKPDSIQDYTQPSNGKKDLRTESKKHLSFLSEMVCFLNIPSLNSFSVTFKRYSPKERCS
uniref:Uncharacterized protein n=1 Tax=Arcella intermedia TaxID=1963864 RepID=A0A6B2LPJ7_9EUKA